MVFLSLRGLGWWFLEPHTFLILGLLQWLLSQTSMNEIDKRVPENCLKWYHENISELEWMSCTTNITMTWKSILCMVGIPMNLYILISISNHSISYLVFPLVISLSRSQSSSLKNTLLFAFVVPTIYTWTYIPINGWKTDTHCASHSDPNAFTTLPNNRKDTSLYILRMPLTSFKCFYK